MSVYKTFLTYSIVKLAKLCSSTSRRQRDYYHTVNRALSRKRPPPEEVQQDHTHNRKGTKAGKQSYSIRDPDPLKHGTGKEYRYVSK